MSDLQCPFRGHTGATTPAGGTRNSQWWPDQIDLGILHQHHPAANPLGVEFDYPAAFSQLDYAGLKADLKALMTDSRSGGPPIGTIMAACSSAWPGTAPAPIAAPTVAVEPAMATSASHR